MEKISTRLISQYYNSPRIAGVLDAFEDAGNDGILVASDDLKPMMASEAKGYWLELLAMRFNFSRPLLSDPNSAKAFGLVENGINRAGKGTFSQAPFVKDGEGYSAGRQEASDRLFATLIAMKASSLRTDGSQDDINVILDGLFSGSFAVDNQDMTMTVLIHLEGFKPTQVDTILTGTVGTIIPAGSTASTSRVDPADDIEFRLQSDVILLDDGAGGGQGFGSFSSTSSQQEPIAIGELDTITSAIIGWDTVANTTAGSSGSNDVNIILDNPDLIPRPVGVGMDVVTFSYFGYNGNEVGFDQGVYGN